MCAPFVAYRGYIKN